MNRNFMISEIKFAERSFLMESVLYPWGRDDQVVEHIVTGTFDELESLKLWMFAVLTAPPNCIAVDVGAYSGLFALLAGSSRPDLKCIAIEPSTMTFGRLARNVTLNSMELQIIPANLAASDVAATVTFPHAFGIFAMNSGDGLNQSVVDHTEAITAVPLDAMLEPREQLPHFLNTKATSFVPFDGIAAIKIDVEGHEAAVLRGGLNLIRKHRPIFICEFLDLDAERSITSVLAPEGYVINRIDGERNLIAVPQERQTEWNSGFGAWKEFHVKNLNLRAETVVTFSPN